MPIPPNPKAKPVVLPPDAISNILPESFEDPARGNVAWRTLFTHPTTPTTDLSAGIAICPGYSGSLSSHRHAQAEIYYILQGQGVATLDGVGYDVEKGSAIFIPGDMEHSVRNTEAEELRWLYVFPSTRFSDVIYHFSRAGMSKL